MPHVFGEIDLNILLQQVSLAYNDEKDVGALANGNIIFPNAMVKRATKLLELFEDPSPSDGKLATALRKWFPDLNDHTALALGKHIGPVTRKKTSLVDQRRNVVGAQLCMKLTELAHQLGYYHNETQQLKGILISCKHH